ncbi:MULTISPECIES: O-antigen ligase [unclassified Cupriavidus]|uniref:O-antigen ligase family protein n=1 Tax=unclassified Cupriavidus TaxID=2640874 RepID=UPI0010F4756A|nr:MULTISPECIES: O-antigen ligase family protein [unclassified Cupriavidus]MWL88185.1 O-antigen ligase family protein [Cupriavidus sp. SW-Y-13]
MNRSTLQLSRAADALLFAFPILVLCVPRGAGVFLAGVGILAIVGWRRMESAWRDHSTILRPLTLTVVAFLAVFFFSKFVHQTPWDVIDNPSRVLLAVLTCWVVVRARPDSAWLWRGISVALFVALFIVAYQKVMLNEPRPGAWIQAIAFANMVAALSLIGFARPGDTREVHGQAWLNILCGAAILMLNGTRGAMVAMMLTLVPMLMIRYRRVGFRMFAAAVAGTIVLAAAAYLAPGSPVSNRVDQAISEIQQFKQGNYETSVGVRLRIWEIGTDYLREHPWTGIGVGQFARILHATPYCHERPHSAVCVLEHAHNDIVEVAATTGVFGLTAFLALFFVPAVLFLRAMLQASSVGSAQGISLGGGGLGFVLASLICGLTQVTMAHQANVVFYAGVTGLLLGLASCESLAGRKVEQGANPRSAPAASTA